MTKLLLAVFIATLSQASFGQQVLNRQQRENVVLSLRQTIMSYDLHCRSSDGDRFRASEIPFDDFKNQMAELYSSEPQRIVFSTQNHKERTKTIFYATNTRVRRIEGEIWKRSWEYRNVGTVLNPNYQEVVTETLEITITCE